MYCDACVPNKTARRRMQVWGITQAQFEALFEAQGKLCACCERDLSNEESKKVHIDHCHKTGRIRAIVCANCNYMLGLIESPWWQERFQKAKEYLKRNGV